MIPYNIFKTNTGLTKRNVVVNFSGTPTFFNISKCIVKYDKTFAFSWSMDDSLGDAALIALPAFHGGNVVHKDGIELNYPGMKYTDGCGNDVDFNFELKTNGANLTNNSSSGYYMNNKDFRKAYVKGCSYVNHSLSHKATDEEFSTDPTIKEQQIIAEIIDNYNLVKNVTGIRMNNFSVPSNYPPYFPIAYQMYLAGTIKRINYMRPDLSTTVRQNYPSTDYSLEFYSTLTEIGSGAVRDFNTWKHSTILDSVADMVPIQTVITNTNALNHYWITAASHALGLNFGVADGDPGMGFKWVTFKAFFERLQSTYGKTGNDSIWMENDNNVWEYLQCYKNIVITSQNLTSTKKNINLDFSQCNPEYRYHSTSFIISTNVNVTSLQFEGFDKSSYKLNYKSLGNGNVLVNVEYMPLYEKALFRRLNALVCVETFEFTNTSADKVIAQASVDLLLNGSYKTSLQARIDAVTVLPDSINIRIDLGSTSATYQTATPWNNMALATNAVVPAGTTIANLLNTSSQTTGIALTVVSQFSAVASAGATDDGTLLYPYSAHRDSFSTAIGTYGVIKLSGLNASKLYDIKLYGSRASIVSVQKYTVNGVTRTLDIKNNRNVTVDFPNTVPVSNEITIRVEGNTGSTVGYLSVIEITEHQ